MRSNIFTKMMTVGLLCTLVIGAGCKGGNIFGFRGTDDSNAGDLIVKGQELMRDGKFAEALVELNKAVAADSLNSDALFFAAKAEFLASGFSVVELLQDITTDLASPGNVPIFTSTKVVGIKPVLNQTEQTKLLQTVNKIADRLQPILDGLTRGTFSAEDVGLEAGIAKTLRAILRLKDTNNDGVIDSNDLDLSLINKGGGDYEFDLDTAIDTPEKGDQFNTAVSDFCEGDQSAVKQIIEDLRTSGLLDNTSDTSIDLNTLETELNRLGVNVCEYFVNTGVAGNKGEGDNDGDGRVDEELLDGIDNDGDGKIDEDSRLSKAADGIDNDNDGKTDEELADGIDNDNDGRIDEDTFIP